MFDFFDTSLLTTLLPIFILGIILIFFIFTRLFKLSSKVKLFFMAAVIGIFIFAAGIALIYVSNNSFEYLNVKKYAVTGKVLSINKNEMEVSIITSNQENLIGRVKIKINDTTAIFSQKESVKLKKISLSEIIATDKVDITCTYDEDVIIAIKIVVK